MNIAFKQLDIKQIGELKPLWQELINYLLNHTTNHQEFFKTRNFHDRIAPYLEKANKGKYLILVAMYNNKNIGYAFSSITKDNIGELDSIYVNEAYRKYNVGATLMSKTNEFFDLHQTKKDVLKVSEGNETVISFYNKFGFQVESYRLERKNGNN